MSSNWVGDMMDIFENGSDDTRLRVALELADWCANTGNEVQSYDPRYGYSYSGEGEWLSTAFSYAYDDDTAKDIALRLADLCNRTGSSYGLDGDWLNEGDWLCEAYVRAYGNEAEDIAMRIADFCDFNDLEVPLNGEMHGGAWWRGASY